MPILPTLSCASHLPCPFVSRPSLLLLVTLLLVVGLAAPAPGADEWALTYVRQYGKNHNAGNALAEIFATNENGSFAQIGITNQYNPTFAVFGQTNPASNPFTPGNLRILYDPAVDPYDFRVYDPSAPSEQTPDLWWNQAALPDTGHYGHEIHFRYISDDSQTTFFPQQPVYHYDLVSGLNTSTSEPANYNSDANSLTNWDTTQAQTFVVPAGVNRIIEAKAFCIRGAGKFTMIASIHQGGPTGPQIGPSVQSREVNSNEFNNVLMCWGLDDVPVTPGQTYALVLESLDGTGFNAYGTNADNYASGQMYNGTTAVTGRDLVGVVVGAYRGSVSTTPTPTPTPGSGSCNFSNPGFESDLANWSRLNSDPAFYTTTGEFGYAPHGGSKMFGGTHSYTDGGALETVYQTLCVSPGSTYEFSAWAITGQVGGSADDCRVRLRIDQSGGTSFTNLVGYQSPTSWTRLSGQFTATGSSVTLGIQLNQQASLQWNHYYIDDVNLALVSGGNTPTPTPTPVASTPTPTPTSGGSFCNFANPGFESALANWSRTDNDPTFYTVGSEFGYSPHGGSTMFGGTHSYTDGGSTDTVYQTLCTSPGSSYEFSAWAITGQAGGTADNCRVRLKVDLNGGTSFTDLSGWQSPTSWTRLAVPFTATGTSVTLGIELNQQVNLQWNHYYIDDINLTLTGGPVATPTPTPTPVAPTATPTATATPVGPTATPTPTVAPASEVEAAAWRSYR